MAAATRSAPGRLAWVVVVAILLIGGLVGPARADKLPTGNISEIKIEGADTVSEEKIHAKIKSRVGRPFDKRQVEEDQQTLYKANWFTDVRTFARDDKKGGVVLIITVVEKPIIRVLEFRGMHNLKQKDVEESTRLRKGGRADEFNAVSAVRSITEMYKEKGFEFAEVRLIEGGKPGSTKVVFEIFEGPKCRVVGVDFEGNHYVESGVLATKINTGPKLMGLWPKKFTPEDLAEDRKKLIEYYDGQGFLKVKIETVTRAEPNQGDVRVTFVIWEDVQYKVRQIRFEGNEKIDTTKLMDGMKLKDGQPYSQVLKDVDEKLIKSKYGAIGCIDAFIRAEREYTDQPGVVDLAYVIDEGNPYWVGALQIKGNGRTQDRVIRREFNMAGIVPGQPLDQNRIELAIQRINRLKYFVGQQGGPSGSKPLSVHVDNKRSQAQLYANTNLPSADLSETVRARLQSGGPEVSPPPRQVARLPTPIPAPGDGPANVAPIVEPPADFNLPPIDAPGPAIRAPPAAGDMPNPLPNPPARNGNNGPPGSFPSLPAGNNLTDTGPDRQEPFTNRSIADIVTSLDEAPTGSLMFGVGASSYGGLFANFIVHESNFDYKDLPKKASDLFSGQAFRGGGQDLRIELSPGTQINRAQISFRNPYLFDLPIGFNASAYTFKRYYPGLDRAARGHPYRAGQAVRRQDVCRRGGAGRGREHLRVQESGPGRPARGLGPFQPLQHPADLAIRQPERPVHLHLGPVPGIRLRAILGVVHLRRRPRSRAGNISRSGVGPTGRASGS